MADPLASAAGTSTIVAGSFHRAADGRPTVRGVLHRPASPARDGLVLTHGAGGNCGAPLLVALGDAFAAAGVTVLRCDLPYRQARPKGPPFPSGAARDRDGLRQAVRELRWILPGRVFVGGQSYGGRQASMLAADEPGLADGLLLLSYPLHPPGRVQELRTDHFSRLRTPALFAHGSLDPFGSLDEIEAARPAIAAPTSVIAIDGAGHGLGRGTRAPWPAADTIARIVTAFVAFVAPSGADAAESR
jgi:predicted alpha/beta-hydrolase family hydrolase